MKLAELLKGYRESRKLTIDELADEIGIDRMALYRLEKGSFKQFKQWPTILRWVFSE